MDATRDLERSPAERLAEVLEWLFVVFETRLGLAQVLATVHDCYHALNIDEAPTAIRRLEGIAFDRLDELAIAQQVDGELTSETCEPDRDYGEVVTAGEVLDILEDLTHEVGVGSWSRAPSFCDSLEFAYGDAGADGIVAAVLRRTGLPLTALPVGRDGLPAFEQRRCSPIAKPLTLGAVVALRAAAGAERRGETRPAGYAEAMHAVCRLMDVVPTPADPSTPMAMRTDGDEHAAVSGPTSQLFGRVPMKVDPDVDAIGPQHVRT